MKEYNVYIDESGDEGLQRGSKYFILTAVLVSKEKDLNVSKKVDEIKQNINISLKSQLHWNSIKGYSNKIMIVSKIFETDITIINIVIDTLKIKYIKSIEIYNHFSGYLYERISWFLKSENAIANINISSRGNLSKKNLIEFLNLNSDKFKIDFSRLNKINIYANSQKKLLQLADCCCSALGQALKYNDRKHQKYITYLYQKYYSYKGKYLGYGLKYVPGNTNYSKEFQELILYLAKLKSELSPD